MRQRYWMQSGGLAATLAIILLLGLTGCGTTSKQPDASLANQECVVLVHGLWRSNIAMWPIERSLLTNGYAVVNLNYASTRKSLAEIAEQDLAPAVASCHELGPDKVHLVTHSLGGIVARQYLQNRVLPGKGRLVMLSPPNQGSPLVSRFHQWPLFGLLVGPAAAELREDAEGVSRRLAPLQLEVGVIMGSTSNPWLPASLLPQPNDGTITVASAHLQEMKDFLLLDTNHVAIRHDERVLLEIAHFLRHGSFRSPP